MSYFNAYESSQQSHEWPPSSEEEDENEEEQESNSNSSNSSLSMQSELSDVSLYGHTNSIVDKIDNLTLFYLERLLFIATRGGGVEDEDDESSDDDSDDDEDEDSSSSEEEGRKPRRRRKKKKKRENTSASSTFFSTSANNSEAVPATTGAINTRRSFSLHNCRQLTSLLKVLTLIRSLILSHRTVTLREVYYTYVTYFRSYGECTNIVNEISRLLNCPRSALNIYASPKGWICGRVRFETAAVGGEDGYDSDRSSGRSDTTKDVNEMFARHEQSLLAGARTSSSSSPFRDDSEAGAARGSHAGYTYLNEESEDQQQQENNYNFSSPARAAHLPSPTTNNFSDNLLTSKQGMAITYEWLLDKGEGKPTVLPLAGNDAPAQFILVIEKEGIYLRLSEDKFYDRCPCILICGKGFPDLATRALTFACANELNLPVYGLCDCNPFGLSILSVYRQGSAMLGVDANRFSVNVKWIGLKPSQVDSLHLPLAVYQVLTKKDESCLTSLETKNVWIEEQVQIEQEARQRVLGGGGGSIVREMAIMKREKWKVELESLHSLGMHYMSSVWLPEEIARQQRSGSANNSSNQANQSHLNASQA
jgi:DNA topoisomerase VI subunit A